jgi:hypothetical protein
MGPNRKRWSRHVYLLSFSASRLTPARAFNRGLAAHPRRIPPDPPPRADCIRVGNALSEPTCPGLAILVQDRLDRRAGRGAPVHLGGHEERRRASVLAPRAGLTDQFHRAVGAAQAGG